MYRLNRLASTRNRLEQFGWENEAGQRFDSGKNKQCVAKPNSEIDARCHFSSPDTGCCGMCLAGYLLGSRESRDFPSKLTDL